MDAQATFDLALPAYLDTEAAVGLAGALKARLADGHGVSINAVDVRRIGTPAVQVLLASARSFATAGQAFQISALSAEFQSVFDDLGLQADLNAWRLKHA